MLMAGANSHERLLNPCHLLHSGSTSTGTRRLLLRLALKGKVDMELLERIKFSELVQQIAGLKKFYYVSALGKDSKFAAAKAAKEAGDISPDQLQLLEHRHQEGKYVCVHLYMY